MKKEKFIVTTVDHRGTHQEIWDSAHPKALGHPFRWVLENTASGVRLRNITGKSGDLAKSNWINIPLNAIDHDEVISLPHDESLRGIQKLKVARQHFVRPPYLHNEAHADGGVPHLFAFSGIRRALYHTEEVTKSFVGYCKDKPAFSFFHSKDKYTLKILINEMQIKFKGEQPRTLEVGASIDLDEKQMLGCTVIRGIYWWRFNSISLTKEWINTDRHEEKNKIVPFYKRSHVVFSSIFALMAISILLAPTPEKPSEEEKKDVPVVTLKFAKSKFDSSKFGDKLQPVISAEEMAAAAGKSAPAATSTKANTTAAPKVSAAEMQSRKLKDAFKGFGALVSKKANTTVANPANTSTPVFDSSATGISKTQVKVAGNVDTKVGGIGGATGPNANNGTAVGYGAGKLGTASGGNGSFVSMDPGGSVVEEGLTKEEVGAVIHSHMNEVRYCHESALVIDPKAEGKLMVQFSIGASGDVKVAKAQDSHFSESKLDTCIISRLMTWKFPKPKGGVTVSVTYPFIFKTVGK